MSTDVVEGLAKARERLKAGFHATQDEVDEIAILTVAADMIEEMRAYLEGFPAVKRHRRVVTVRVVRARKDPAAERPDPPEPDGQQ